MHYVDWNKQYDQWFDNACLSRFIINSPSCSNLDSSAVTSNIYTCPTQSSSTMNFYVLDQSDIYTCPTQSSSIMNLSVLDKSTIGTCSTQSSYISNFEQPESSSSFSPVDKPVSRLETFVDQYEAQLPIRMLPEFNTLSNDNFNWHDTCYCRN